MGGRCYQSATSKAEAWGRSPFTGKARKGYNVVKSRVRASEVGWSGKNLEFVYVGSKSTGKSRKLGDRNL